MNKRPLSITLISWIFIAAGSVGVAYHASELKTQHSFESDILWVVFVRLLAIIGGVFMLRGHNWARWLLVAWMAYHIVLSALHSVMEVAMHALLFGVIGYFLFRPKASAYFRGTRTGSNKNEA
jgi:hypothetical protein